MRFAKMEEVGEWSTGLHQLKIILIGYRRIQRLKHTWHMQTAPHPHQFHHQKLILRFSRKQMHFAIAFFLRLLFELHHFKMQLILAMQAIRMWSILKTGRNIGFQSIGFQINQDFQNQLPGHYRQKVRVYERVI